MTREVGVGEIKDLSVVERLIVLRSGLHGKISSLETHVFSLPVHLPSVHACGDMWLQTLPSQGAKEPKQTRGACALCPSRPK